MVSGYTQFCLKSQGYQCHRPWLKNPSTENCPATQSSTARIIAFFWGHFAVRKIMKTLECGVEYLAARTSRQCLSNNSVVSGELSAVRLCISHLEVFSTF